MGIVLWFLSGLVAFFAARRIPAARPLAWIGELLLAMFFAGLAGLGATYLDFGGWRELDWRAGLFALIVALGGLGLVRAIATAASRASNR